MAFNSNTPQPLEAMRDSQPLFLDNFQEIDTFFGVDHFDFGSPNVGKHIELTLTQQDKNTIPAPGANDYLLFQALSALSNLNQLYSKTPAGNVLEFSDINVFEKIGVGFLGWAALPSGIIIKWDIVEVSIDLPLAGFPPVNNAYTVTFNWATQPGQKVFTNQFWSYVTVVPGSKSFAIGTGLISTFDPTVVTYVKDISDPTKVLFNVWLRNTFNNALSTFTNLGFPQTYPFLIVSIGV